MKRGAERSQPSIWPPVVSSLKKKHRARCVSGHHRHGRQAGWVPCRFCEAVSGRLRIARARCGTRVAGSRRWSRCSLLLLLLRGSSNAVPRVYFSIFICGISTRVSGDVFAPTRRADVLPEKMFFPIRSTSNCKKISIYFTCSYDVGRVSFSRKILTFTFNAHVLPLLRKQMFPETFECLHLSFTTDFAKV